jgi:hypothetical protein
MFDRQVYLLEALRTLSTFTGGDKTGYRLTADAHYVVRSFAHSYVVFRRLFPDRLNQIDTRPLDELFNLVKDIEPDSWPTWELPKVLEWLQEDVKHSRFWQQVRELACQGACLIGSLPPSGPGRSLMWLPLAVVHRSEVPPNNYPPPSEIQENDEGFSKNDFDWYSLRRDLVNALEKHGLTAPDDPAADPHFFLVDDQYNDERYHYLEICSPAVLSLDWLEDMTNALRCYPGWGVITNLREGRLVIFDDRLLVVGPAFRTCRTAASVLKAIKADTALRPADEVERAYPGAAAVRPRE